MHAVVARAPGKLVVAGEYAVLEAGHRAVATAVQRHVTVLLRPTARRTVQLGDRTIAWQTWGRGALIAGDGAALRLIEGALSAAMETAQAEGARLDPFALVVRNRLADPNRQKLGLGASAATAVAVVAALLHAVRGTSPSHSEVFRIAAAAHHAVQGSGSGIDVAAAAHGGWIVYRGFGEKWLGAELARGGSPAEVAAGEWPGVEVTRLPAPPVPLQIGWTGEPASTAQRLAQLKDDRTRDEAAYNRFLQESEQAVSALCAAMQNGALGDLAAALRGSREVLGRMSARLGFAIETPALRALADAAARLGGGGKASGAGGGDCGIAVVPAHQCVALREMWIGSGVVPLELACGAEGVRTRMAY